MGLKLKLFRGRKEDYKKNQGRIMTTLGPYYDADATKVVPEPY